jgi:L-lysine exporter family protein LysE/ArgO
MTALIAGFLTGLSLIVAIGAQNAYVLRMGLSKHHVAAVVAICAASDVMLILLGIGGIGGIIKTAPSSLQVLRWVGVVYLSYFAVRSFMKALQPESLSPADAVKPSLKVAVATTLAFTFLNPHVYIDTVLLLGSIGNQYGHSRWTFATGAGISSVMWFSSLGFGARYASRFMSKPITWRILDSAIGVVMVLIALKLAFSPLAI